MRQGMLFVVDEGNNRFQKFDSNGNFITKWGTTGSGDDQFEEPTSIALDSSGNVYVVNSGNARIQVFAPSS
jgi:DNA-binding beta-propeller fold protein YncE